MSNETTPIEQNETFRSFLQEELDDTSRRLDLVKDKIEKQKARGIKAWFRRLRGRIDEEEYRSLKEQWEEKNTRLTKIPEDDVRLFILRKEVGALKEEVDTLGAERRWHIPLAIWVVIVLLAIFIYFASLAVIQGVNQDIIGTYAAQTETARPTTVPSPAWTPTPIPINTP